LLTLVPLHVPLQLPVFVQVSGRPPPITQVRVEDPSYGTLVDGLAERVRVGFWSSTVTVAFLVTFPPLFSHVRVYVLVLFMLGLNES